MDDIDWFAGGEQRDASPISEETQVTVICHDVDRIRPRKLSCRSATRTSIIHSGYVDTREANARESVEDVAVKSRVRERRWWNFGKRLVRKILENDLPPLYIFLKVVLLASETEFEAKSDGFPDGVVGVYLIG